jgi:PAS domain S-box-containing protein
VTHPDDLEADLALAGRLLAGEIPSYRIEKRYRHRDGSIVWGDLAASLVRGAGGEPRYAVGVLVDITRQKQAEARLEAVLASIDDHLASYDRRWRYTFVNDPAARVLGRRKDELIGECIWELFPDAVGNQFYREVTGRSRSSGSSARSITMPPSSSGSRTTSTRRRRG